MNYVSQNVKTQSAVYNHHGIYAYMYWNSNENAHAVKLHLRRWCTHYVAGSALKDCATHLRIHVNDDDDDDDEGIGVAGFFPGVHFFP